ncbi:AAA family ATPase [Aliarcobacter cryaerophilus]|uniref:AAA family ATPase n=1 Tax=Aliarcobacter cryaerophilus TaxID=28198 RepID=UPI003BB133C8
MGKIELVYLWVEKYKNIENEGFNFSYRFKCEYKNDTKVLTIDEKDNDINIFPKNISFNAIIGTNGSGKSSIAELILLSFFKAKVNNISNNWFLIYDNQEKRFYIQSFGKYDFSKVIFPTSDLKKNSGDDYSNKYYFNKEIRNSFFNLHFNPSMELMSSFFLSHIDDPLKDFDASIYEMDYKPIENLNLFSFPSKDKRILDIKKIENTYILNMFKSKRFMKDQEINKIMGEIFLNDKIKFIPIKVSLKIVNGILRNDLKKDKLRDLIFDNNKIDISLKNLYLYFIMLILSTAYVPILENEKFTDYFFKEGELKKYLSDKYDDILAKGDGGLAYSGNIFNFLAKEVYDDIDNFIYIAKNYNLNSTLRENSDKLDVNVHEIAKLIDVLNELENVNLNDTIIEKSEIERILPVLPSFIKVDAIDKNEINFSDFSSGEKNLIGLIYSLIYYISFYKNDKQVMNIVLDEVEIGLNPKWQKNLVFSIINLLKNFDNDFILTIVSHSPFILSDLPKENVIFLENGKQKENVFKENEQTFGANIHTLLSHGFFMDEGGLIGEFAKNKINELIKYLNNVESEIKTIQEAQNIINIIGEPVLKSTLQNMLDEKYSTNTKLDKLKSEKARLEKEIQKLEFEGKLDE